MTESSSSPSDGTRTTGPQPSTVDQTGVRGGNAADRMDSPDAGSGGLSPAGADGATDDPQGGSVQEHGSRP